MTGIPDSRLAGLLAARQARRELADGAMTKASLDHYDSELALWLARLSDADRAALTEWDALVDGHKAALTHLYQPESDQP